MKIIKCLFCGKPTTIHKINAQKKINGKTVTITDAPVYYCAQCDETFISKEAQDVFNHIRDRNLEARAILYNFDDMINKIY